MNFESKKIRKAIFPVAGLGTRFLPATKATPKEMLPVIDKPLIQYAVEEAYEAGIREMIFVTGRNKRAIEDHFDLAYELDDNLIATQKFDLLEIVDSVKPLDMSCVYVRQPKARGLGHAIWCARHLIDNEPFAIVLADDFMVGSPNILLQMIQQYQHYHCSIIAIEQVKKSQTKSYGIIDAHADEQNPRIMHVTHLVEKPECDDAPSLLAITGRYITTPKLFDLLGHNLQGSEGEIQLTDALVALLQYETIIAYLFDGARYDCGSKLGLLQANVDRALNNSSICDEFLFWLEQHPILKSYFKK